MPRRTAFVNCGILTMDSREEGSALIIEGNKILYVSESERGTLAKLSPGDVVYDLEGRWVIPGFIDSHTHISTVGMMEIGVDLSGAESKEEVVSRIKKKLKSIPCGGWVYARGWDETLWGGGYLTRGDLDKVSKDQCIVAVRVCGHLATVNTRGLVWIKESLRKQPGYYDMKSGILREDAVSDATRMVYASTGIRERAIIQGQKRALTLGITSIHDIVSRHSIPAYMALWKEHKLLVRTYLTVETNEVDAVWGSRCTGYGDEWLRVGGVKAYMDGSIGARTAALCEPYADDPNNRGRLLLSRRTVRTLIRDLSLKGFQVWVHAIGDRAISTLLEAFSGIKKVGRLTHRVEHAEMVSREDIRIARQTGIAFSMQPNFIGQWGQKGGMYEVRLGKKRVSSMNPIRKVIDSDILLGFGSDCMPLDPLYGIRSTVFAPYACQRVKPIEALKAYTCMGAMLSGESELKGRVSEGMLADLTILSHDPVKNLRKTSVEATIVDGIIAWKKVNLKKKGV